MSPSAGARKTALALVLAAAWGCGTDAPPAEETGGAPPAFDMEAVDFAPELSVELGAMERHPSGMYVEEVRVGSGAEVDPGSTVAVHYTGWLPDGTEFDSSRDQDRPFSFVVGVGRVIQGWDRGMLGMRVGGVRRLVIPPDLGYGDQGAGGVISPGSALVFEVEVVDVTEPGA